MKIILSVFIMLLSILLALSSSAIEMAAAGRLHHHGHHQISRDPYPPFQVYNLKWDFNVRQELLDNITFRAGDILVFNYDEEVHNVVLVDKANYLDCSIPEVAAVFYNSGHDEIVIGPGTNYFICGTMGHCIAGMAINVTTKPLDLSVDVV